MVGKKVEGSSEQRRAAARQAEAGVRGPAGLPRAFTGSETSEYTAEHEQLFAALIDAQQANDGEAVYLDEIARRSGQDHKRTRALLHDLTEVHHLVTQLHQADSPDLGPRFEVKRRL
jgi:hypothetical protein